MTLNQTYKSLEYSKKENDKSWGILSFSLVNRKDLNSGSIYLSRTILYLESDNTVSQIGKMYVPLFSFKYISFFARVIFSRKTLGHYIKEKYNHIEDNISFRIQKEFQSKLKYSMILNKKEYTVMERVIDIKTAKLSLYVEEYS